ncbi:hypothetical protein BC831DRAFT_443282 [Entophlyctis helioformis]|nr:hypothetical protein BC831DRAFT_443282 [Entophlyctis helioformis]
MSVACQMGGPSARRSLSFTIERAHKLPARQTTRHTNYQTDRQPAMHSAQHAAAPLNGCTRQPCPSQARALAAVATAVLVVALAPPSSALSAIQPFSLSQLNPVALLTPRSFGFLPNGTLSVSLRGLAITTPLDAPAQADSPAISALGQPATWADADGRRVRSSLAVPLDGSSGLGVAAGDDGNRALVANINGSNALANAFVAVCDSTADATLGLRLPVSLCRIVPSEPRCSVIHNLAEMPRVVESGEATDPADSTARAISFWAMSGGFYSVYLVACLPPTIQLLGTASVQMTNPVAGLEGLSSEQISLVMLSAVFAGLWGLLGVVWAGRCWRNQQQFKSTSMLWLISALLGTSLCLELARVGMFLWMARVGRPSTVLFVLVEMLLVVHIVLTVSVQLLLSKGFSITRPTLTTAETRILASVITMYTVAGFAYNLDLQGSIFGSAIMEVVVYVLAAYNIRHALIVLETYIHSIKTSSEDASSEPPLPPSIPQLAPRPIVPVGVSQSASPLAVDASDVARESGTKAGLAKAPSLAVRTRHYRRAVAAFVMRATSRLCDVVWPVSKPRFMYLYESWNILDVYEKKLQMIRSLRYYVLFWGLLPVVTKTIDLIRLDSWPFPTQLAGHIGTFVIHIWLVFNLCPVRINEAMVAPAVRSKQPSASRAAGSKI